VSICLNSRDGVLKKLICGRLVTDALMPYIHLCWLQNVSIKIQESNPSLEEYRSPWSGIKLKACSNAKILLLQLLKSVKKWEESTQIKREKRRSHLTSPYCPASV